MDISIAVCNRILELCEENNLTINKLANISGLPPSSLKNILYRKSKNPKIRTIKIICDGLGISLSEFFQSDDFDSLEQEIK
jgi:transcriptional regulator with XRE-family HTH domain